MSKCPYAAGFVEDFQQTVYNVNGLADIMNITMNYIANVDPTQPTGFYSKHGQSEVYGDFTELCVASSITADQWWSFIVCMYKNYDQIPNNGPSCATSVGFDFNSIKNCVSSENSSKLLKKSINITDSLGWNPRPGSPTVYVNKQCIYGLPPCQALDPSGNQVIQFICNQYTGKKPVACTAL